jgi:hypothetical protein
MSAALQKMTNDRLDTLATLLGVTVGAALDCGFTSEQIAAVFARKNIIAAAQIVASKDNP